MLTTSTQHGFQTTYPCILGRIVCLEERWKLQRFVKVVEYFAAPLDYLRLSHWFWRHSGRVLCAFISEGRMLPMLERLDPTAYKRKDYMITSDSFIFQMSNGFQDAVNFLATRSFTRPAHSDLGSPRNSFWEGRFEVSNMKLEFFPLDSFARWIISQVLVPGLRTEY